MVLETKPCRKSHLSTVPKIIIGTVPQWNWGRKW